MEKGDLKIGDDTVVHCPTKELARKVLNIAGNLGYEFEDSEEWGLENLLEHCWSRENGEDTCIRLRLQKTYFAIRSAFERAGYNVIEAEDFLKLHGEKQTDTIMEKRDLKIGKKTVVFCPTRELALKVLDIATSLGYPWLRKPYEKDTPNWESHKDKTCYDLHSMTYGDYYAYDSDISYTIISAEDFLKLHEEKEKQREKINDESVVHCPTEELLIKVIEILKGLDYKWLRDRVLDTKAIWASHREETCVPINKAGYGSSTGYKDDGRPIIEAEDFIDYYKDGVAEHAPTKTNPKSILLEASQILNGGRQADYGDAVDNFKHIAAVVNAALRRDDITPELCCMVHIATKLCREGNKHKRDNLVDLSAYSDILNKIEDEKNS